MNCYCCSDIHIDHYCKKNINDAEVFDTYIEKYLLPADILFIAGDISDNKDIFINFVSYVSSKYKYVIYTIGNHDMNVRKNSLYATIPKYYSTSLQKLADIDNALSIFPNIIRLNNSKIIEKVPIGGTMGMCDFEYAEHGLHLGKQLALCEWQTWYDNIVWNHMNNDPISILNDEQNKLNIIVNTKPKIILTHFAPIEIGIQPKYAKYLTSAFFYFYAEKYLDNLDNDTYWICGHTHDAAKLDYVNSSGNVIHILLNPIGYPSELPYDINNLSKSDFLINI